MTDQAVAPCQAAAPHCQSERDAQCAPQPDSIAAVGVAQPLSSHGSSRHGITAGAAWRKMLGDLRQDLDRYVYMPPQPLTMVRPSVWRAIRVLLSCQGMWVMVQYRFSRWVHFHFHIPVLRSLLKLVCVIWQKLIEMVTCVELPNRAEIGGGVFMPHANGIIVHIDAKIGENCNLSQQVTIGVGGTDPSGTPIIGDRVFLGPGAKVFGPITIGDDVAIGANAVVTKDLPQHVVAVGIPAKVISTKGSTALVLYPGCKAHAPAFE
jgi:serine O-acetyltransferase